MRFEHPVFQGPREVDATTVEKIDQFSKKKIQAWRVHEDLGKPGLVATRRKFIDMPDSEILSGGTNMKGDRGVPLVREGNLFLWGFAGSPAEMTGPGKAALVNAIVYIKGFAGELPTRRAGILERHRWKGILDSPYVKPRSLPTYFGPDLVALHGADKDAYRVDLEKREAYLHVPAGTNHLSIDADAEALGLPTDGLELIRAALESPDERGQRILHRYWPDDELVIKRPASVEELEAIADEVVFSEANGYRWLSKPPLAGPQGWEVEDALALLDTPEPSELAPASFVARLVGGYNAKEMTYDRRLGLVTLAVRAELLEGWHIGLESEEAGMPPVQISLDLLDGMRWQDREFSVAGKSVAVEGGLQGEGRLTWTRRIWLRDCAAGTFDLSGKIRFQVCDESHCLEPMELPFTVKIKVR